MKKIFVYLWSFVCISCKTNSTENFVVDTAFDISITNQDSIDLLNPKNKNAFIENQIQLFHLENNELIAVNYPDLTYPKGFHIFQKDDTYRIRIFPHRNRNSKFYELIIYWNTTEIDKIKCEMDSSKNILKCVNIWVNDQLVWSENKGERFFEIIK
ncbi:hypothetical protein [Aureivirga marina]|uniref:hypothetical protein n=1 Tax=Aureivirga marina TaxID=1182451 RepID=UPI0018C9BF78|nr:hypothetical protein [Aureivirga marina]